MKKINIHRYISTVAKYTKRVLVVMSVICLMGWASYRTTRFSKEKIIFAEVPMATSTPSISPVLQRIARCESTDMHFKDGQVIMRANTNGSVDIGRYQINMKVWGKKATELGLDLTKESDNEKMAIWIYENRGTEDWYASVKCWR